MQRSIFVVRDLSRHAVAPILVRSRCSISRQTSLRTLVCRQPSDVRQPVINPQLSMMDFVYKIRVTLSSKKCMCFGPEALGGRNERTYMCFARTRANDPEPTFAGSNPAVQRTPAAPRCAMQGRGRGAAEGATAWINRAPRQAPSGRSLEPSLQRFSIMDVIALRRSVRVDDSTGQTCEFPFDLVALSTQIVALHRHACQCIG